MTITYDNMREGSSLMQLELSPQPTGNTAFLSLSSPQDRDHYTDLLRASGLGYRVIAETKVNGHLMLVAKGTAAPSVLLEKLALNGDNLVEHTERKPANWWAIRGGLGMGGQILQLISAFTQVKKENGTWVRKGFSPDLGIFAILNITANLGNFIYGGQQEKDPNRERFAKNLISTELAPHLRAGEKLPSQNRSQRSDPAEHSSPWERFNEFAKRNSVRFFELGLRFVAAIALVIPFRKSTLTKGWQLAKQGEIMAAARAVRNPSNNLFYAGLAFTFGKVVAWFSKVPDPYDPKPHQFMDTIREKFLFPFGSAIESLAGIFIAKNAYFQQHLDFKDAAGTPYRDWLSTVGGSMFTAAYWIRLGAHFGTKQVDMSDVITYTAKTLARTSPEALPKLTADTAAILASHFKDKSLKFGEIYENIYIDLQRLAKKNPALLKSHYLDERIENEPFEATPAEAPLKERPSTTVIHIAQQGERQPEAAIAK